MTELDIITYRYISIRSKFNKLNKAFDESEKVWKDVCLRLAEENKRLREENLKLKFNNN